jgi:hypothetical protein
MTIATALCVSVLCVGACVAAQGEKSRLIACNLKAISSSERPRYSALLKRVREAVQDRTEVANGYAFKLDSKKITLPEAAEWMAMERLCCPFLTLQLSVEATQVCWILTLTGPEGVKSLLEAEFPRR